MAELHHNSVVFLRQIVVVVALLCVGCWRDDKTFEPYTLGGLYVAEPIYIGQAWDDYQNRDPTISESNKMASAQAVFDLMYDQFNPKAEAKDKDVWRELPLYDMTGDCEDHALTCRQLLLSQHWTKNDVILLRAETHTVAGVVINGGIWILDNLESEIVPIEACDYEWFEIYHRGRWYAVE